MPVKAMEDDDAARDPRPEQPLDGLERIILDLASVPTSR